MVLGSISSQARLMKTLSKRSSVGVLRLFDQVKLLSKRGISIRHRSLMQSLKASASCILKLELFFSWVYLIILKSPQSIHGVLEGGLMLLSSSKN